MVGVKYQKSELYPHATVIKLIDAGALGILELRHHAQLPALAQLVKPHERAEASGVHVCEVRAPCQRRSSCRHSA